MVAFGIKREIFFFGINAFGIKNLRAETVEANVSEHKPR